jgi:BMFP domain-containing protein YqiC
MLKISGEMSGKAIMAGLVLRAGPEVNRRRLVCTARRPHIGVTPRRPAMQTRNKFFDDLSQLATNAMGVAQGAKTEAETAMKSLMDRWLAGRDFVTREEFEAVRAMAVKAREENEALAARIAALEARTAAS